MSLSPYPGQIELLSRYTPSTAPDAAMRAKSASTAARTHPAVTALETGTELAEVGAEVAASAMADTGGRHQARPAGSQAKAARAAKANPGATMVTAAAMVGRAATAAQAAAQQAEEALRAAEAARKAATGRPCRSSRRSTLAA